MKTKIILMFLAVIILAGCGSLPSTPDLYTTGKVATNFNEEQFKKHDRAVVIFNINNNMSATYNIKNYMTVYSLDNPDLQYKIYMDNNEIVTLMLTPGKYKITDIEFYGSMNAGKFNYSKSLDLKKSFIGEFELLPSDVNYIGKIKVFTISEEPTKSSIFSGSSQSKTHVYLKTVDEFESIDSEFKTDLMRKTGQKIKIKLLKIITNN